MPFLYNLLGSAFDLRLVLIAFLLALSVCFLQLNITHAIKLYDGSRFSYPRYHFLWGSTLVGSGIWCCSLITILSRSPSEIAILDVGWITISGFLSLLVNGFVFLQFRRGENRLSDMLTNGLLLGMGSSLVHFTNIESLRPTMEIAYDLPTIYLTLLMMITTGVTAAWIVDSIRDLSRMRATYMKCVGAFLLAILYTFAFYIGLNAVSLTEISSLTGGQIGQIDGIRFDHFERSLLISICFVLIGVGNILMLIFEYYSISIKSPTHPVPIDTAEQPVPHDIDEILHFFSKRFLQPFESKEQLITELVAQLEERVGYQRVFLYLLNQSGDALSLAGVDPKSARHLVNESIFSPPIGNSLIGRAISENQAQLSKDIALDPEWLDDELAPPTRSEVALPIRQGNDVSGVLQIKSTIAGQLTDRDISLLASICDLFAAAMQRQELFVEAIHARAAANWQEVASAQEIREVNKEDIRILLIDIDEERQSPRIALSMLNQLGYRAEIAASENEAREKLLNRSYDLILMALHMTDVDEIDLVQTIRQISPFYRPKVIGISPNSYSIVPRIDPDNGFDGFLRKPYRIREIEELLTSVSASELDIQD